MGMSLARRGRWIKFLIFSLAHPLCIYPAFWAVYYLGWYEKVSPGTIRLGKYGISIWIAISIILYAVIVYLKYEKFRCQTSKSFTPDQFFDAHFKSQWPYLLFLIPLWILWMEEINRSSLLFISFVYLLLLLFSEVASILLFQIHFADFM